MGKMIEEINNTYIRSLVEENGLEYWINICQQYDPTCQTWTDLALLQWGYYENRGQHLGLNNLGVKYCLFFHFDVQRK